MNTKISRTTSIPSSESIILVGNKNSALNGYGLTAKEVDHVKKKINTDKAGSVTIDQLSRKVWVQIIPTKNTAELQHEALRIAGAGLAAAINHGKIGKVTVVDVANYGAAVLALAEGLALANYKFVKYFTNSKATPSLKNIKIYSKKLTGAEVSNLAHVLDGTEKARTLVNEPLSFLTAVQLSKEIKKFAKDSGFKVNVLTKSKIESLKMGGLLGVNKGSLDPPTLVFWNGNQKELIIKSLTSW